LILDLSKVVSLGGGGAAALADFQAQLVEQGGEMVFVGNGKVVRKLLDRPFAELPLRFYTDTPAAESAFFETGGSVKDASTVESTAVVASDRPPVAAQQRKPVGETTGAVCLSTGFDAGSDSILDDLLDDFPVAEFKKESSGKNAKDGDTSPSERGKPVKSLTAKSESTATAAQSRRVVSPSAIPPTSGKRGATRRNYISIEEAVVALQRTTAAADLEKPLTDLLRSHDLAAEVTYCFRQGQELATSDGKYSFAGASALTATFTAAMRPLSLLDIHENDLENSEARLLAKIDPDLILPLVWRNELQAVAFLKQPSAEMEYDVGEYFALELLIRVLANFRNADILAGKSPLALRSAGSEPGQHAALDMSGALIRELRHAEILLSVAKQLPEEESEYFLWERFYQVLGILFDVKRLAFVTVEDSAPTCRALFGGHEAKFPLVDLGQPGINSFFAALERPLPVRDLPPETGFARIPLMENQWRWIAALNRGSRLLGIVLIGGIEEHEKSDLDSLLLGKLLEQVTSSLFKLQARDEEAEWNLDLLQAVVTLVGQRNHGSSEVTNHLVRLLHQVAGKMGCTPRQEQELLYGALLRDVGQIPLDDLVLYSPEKMTATQWDQLRGHPEAGLKLLESVKLTNTMKDIVLCHHERYNGEGYPRGLKGKNIPLPARIVAVVENYVSMVTELPSREPLSHKEAVDSLRENWGDRYDPAIVKVLLQVLPQEMKVEPGKPVIA
ncbi:MAG: HD domain-containing phosphohydrolase, partial [bacterium]